MPSSPHGFDIIAPRAKGALIDVTLTLISVCSMAASTYALPIDALYKFLICALITLIIPAIIFISKQLIFTEVRLTEKEIMNYNRLTGESKSISLDQIADCYVHRRSVGFTVLLRIKTQSGVITDLFYHPHKLDAYLSPKTSEEAHF